MDLFTQFWNKIVSFLPVSPFLKFYDSFKDLPGLHYLNWFFPVKECLTVFAAYLTAVAVYYVYSIVMRTINAIE